jgi:hypothetical protein
MTATDHCKMRIVGSEVSSTDGYDRRSALRPGTTNGKWGQEGRIALSGAVISAMRSAVSSIAVVLVRLYSQNLQARVKWLMTVT